MVEEEGSCGLLLPPAFWGMMWDVVASGVLCGKANPTALLCRQGLLMAAGDR